MRAIVVLVLSSMMSTATAKDGKTLCGCAEVWESRRGIQVECEISKDTPWYRNVSYSASKEESCHDINDHLGEIYRETSALPSSPSLTAKVRDRLFFCSNVSSCNGKLACNNEVTNIKHLVFVAGAEIFWIRRPVDLLVAMTAPVDYAYVVTEKGEGGWYEITCLGDQETCPNEATGKASVTVQLVDVTPP